jgi:hypothetical protein
MNVSGNLLRTRMTEPADFLQWIQTLKRERFKTWQKFADAMAMTESGFLRGVRKGKLSLPNLLLLAEVAEAQPLDVLRLAGKTSEAELFQRTFGIGDQALTASQRQLLDQWARLEPADREVLEGLLARFAPPRTPGRTSDIPVPEPTRDRAPKAAAARRRRR